MKDLARADFSAFYAPPRSPQGMDGPQAATRSLQHLGITELELESSGEKSCESSLFHESEL